MGDFFYSGKCNPDLDSIFQCKNPVIGEYTFRHLSQAIRKIAICDVFRSMYVQKLKFRRGGHQREETASWRVGTLDMYPHLTCLSPDTLRKAFKLHGWISHCIIVESNLTRLFYSGGITGFLQWV